MLCQVLMYHFALRPELIIEWIRVYALLCLGTCIWNFSAHHALSVDHAKGQWLWHAAANGAIGVLLLLYAYYQEPMVKAAIQQSGANHDVYVQVFILLAFVGMFKLALRKWVDRFSCVSSR